VATATARAVGSVDAVTTSDSDDHSINLFQPSIDLTKAAIPTFGAVGDTIVYTYTLDNNGSTDSPALIIDSLVDDNGTPGDPSTPPSAGAAPRATGGPPPTKPGPSPASHVVLASAPDPLVNPAVVHAHPLGFPNDLTDTATASVNVFQPGINIDKFGPSLSKI